ncbi:MAG: NUDIX hydrolase [Acidobacteriota bacterium]|jgi:ADP-ribose pyrophosphatase YjhB (NUDIX family)|nr:NUDIX hydrolase [Acidobacteriota bacterium]
MRLTESGIERMAADRLHADRPHLSGEQLAKFCPLCGAPLADRLIEEEQQVRKVCSGCGFIFYLNPKVVAGAVPRQGRDGRIWLLRRNISPGMGLWTFPGGYVDLGESVPDAAVRETFEETRLQVRIDGILNVYSYAHVGIVLVVYRATVTGGEAAPTPESQEARLFRLDEIPWGELAFTSTRDAMRDYVEHERKEPGSGHDK